MSARIEYAEKINPRFKRHVTIPMPTSMLDILHLCIDVVKPVTGNGYLYLFAQNSYSLKIHIHLVFYRLRLSSYIGLLGPLNYLPIRQTRSIFKPARLFCISAQLETFESLP